MVETVEEVSEGVCLREGPPFIEILIKSHGLYQISHPFLTEIHIGEFEVHSILINKIQANEEKLFLAVATQLADSIDADAILGLLILVIAVDL
jgi:hypothetical protein